MGIRSSLSSLAFRALTLGVLGFGATGTAEREFLHPNYSSCAVFLETYAGSYSQRESGGTLTAEDLRSGDWVISEAHGILRVDGYDGTTRRLLAQLPGRSSKAAPSILDAEPGTRFVRLGSDDARGVVRDRTARMFPGGENFDAFFATRGLLAQLSASRTADAPIRETIREVWSTVSATNPTWHGRDFESFLQSNRYIFEMGGLQERTGAPQAASLNTVALLRRFADEFYRRTGHNLVQGGLLESNLNFWRYDGTKAFLAERLGQASQTLLREPNVLLGGPLDRVPLDIFHEVIVQQWRESEAHFGALGRAALSLTAFDSYATAGPAAEHAATLRAFNESGDIGGIRGLLDAAAADPGFVAWKRAVAAGGADVRFVPMPGSEGPSRPTTALAGWAHGAVGVGAVADGAIRLTGSATPQKFQSTLWHRITNVQARDYTVSGDVRGKVVVLVDDVITSGVTVEAMKQRLLQKGARAVYVLALAKTGPEPISTPPERILDLAHTAPASPPASSAMPREAAAFGPWLDGFLGGSEKPAWDRNKVPRELAGEHADLERLLFAELGGRLAAGGRLPWEGKINRNLTAPGQATKKLFEAAFKRRDLALLALLPAGALEALGADGRAATKKESVAGQITGDDVELTSWLGSLRAARDREDFSDLRSSALGRLVLTEAKARRGKGGPFRNQLDEDPALATWLDAQ